MYSIIHTYTHRSRWRNEEWGRERGGGGRNGMAESSSVKQMFIHCKFMFHKQHLFTILCCVWLECIAVCASGTSIYIFIHAAASVAAFAVKYILLCHMIWEMHEGGEKNCRASWKCKFLSFSLTNLWCHLMAKEEMRIFLYCKVMHLHLILVLLSQLKIIYIFSWKRISLDIKKCKGNSLLLQWWIFYFLISLMDTLPPTQVALHVW